MINHKDQYYITIFFTLIRKRFSKSWKLLDFPDVRRLQDIWEDEKLKVFEDKRMLRCYYSIVILQEGVLETKNCLLEIYKKNRTILPNTVFQFVILNQWKVPWNWMTFYWHFFVVSPVWPCKRDPFWNPIVSLKQQLRN